jgi:ribose 5-phosphate isomerase B
MQIYIGADHRGFHLKNTLLTYLQSQNYQVKDLGNHENDPVDDAPVFAQKVADAVKANPNEHMGIVICGSGVAMSIMMNRNTAIRCALAINEDHVASARQHNHINALALGADYISEEKARKIVDTFLSTSVAKDDKYLRRVNQMTKGLS